MELKKFVGISKEFLSRPTTIYILLLVLSFVLIVGCSAESGSPPPPSGPIGGGCG